jgi:hypothetical protein
MLQKAMSTINDMHVKPTIMIGNVNSLQIKMEEVHDVERNHTKKTRTTTYRRLR